MDSLGLSARQVTSAEKERRQSSNRIVYSNFYENRRVNLFTVDCRKCTTGLFFGSLLLLLTIVSLNTYFVYKKNSPSIAIQISVITELTLVGLSFMVTICVYIKLARENFSQKLTFEMDYNETLVIFSLAGIFVYGFYSVIAFLEHGFTSSIEILSFSIQVVSVVEATFQSLLIINSLKMYAKSTAVKKRRPGRALISLLILINVSLWLSETFSVEKYELTDIQLNYYQIVFWSIVRSFSSPLAIFYRFHASVCLSDVLRIYY